MLTLIPWREKWFGGWLWLCPIISVFMLIVAAMAIFNSGINPARQLDAFVAAMASFQANVVSLPFLIAIREIARMKG